METSCQGCGASGTGWVCAYCGSTRTRPGDADREREALDELHRLIGSQDDVLGRGRLLRSGFLPDDPDVLIDAGTRCVPLMDVEALGTGVPEAAADRLRAVLRKLEVAQSPPAVKAPFEAELRRFARAQAADERRLRWGCAGCLLMGLGLAALIAWQWWDLL